MKSVLEFLDNRSVVSFTKNDDGTFHAVELCDRYYFEDLTKEQMLQLAEEIKALAES